ncbi:MAG: acetolactate synthase small subunit [Christensenellales bacterium]
MLVKPARRARRWSRFFRRGFSIRSLAVGPAHDETVSCITIVVNGDEHTLEQVEKQLNKIIPVKVEPRYQGQFVSCGLALVKVQASPKTRA